MSYKYKYKYGGNSDERNTKLFHVLPFPWCPDQIHRLQLAPGKKHVNAKKFSFKFAAQHLYCRTSDPLGQPVRQLQLRRVEEKHLGGVVVVHAAGHAGGHGELARTIVDTHLDDLVKRGNGERSHLAVGVNSGEAVRLKAVTVHSAASTHL